MLALQMGKLKRGATPDREMAARIGRNMTKFNSMDNFFMATLDPLIFGAQGRVWWLLKQLKLVLMMWYDPI